jgi:hypothetical protein
METAPGDPFLRYGLADLIVEELGGDPDAAFTSSDETLTDAAHRRIDDLEGSVRAYLQRTEDGFEGVPVSKMEKGQDKESGYQIRAHVLRPATELNYYRDHIFPASENMESFGSRRVVLQSHHPHVSKLTVKASKKGVDNVKRGARHALLGTIATLTPNKISQWTESQDRVAIIPDLSLDDMVLYIRLAKRLISSGPGLSVRTRQDGSPTLQELRGNYYAAPPSWAFGSLSLLGAAGELSRRFDWSDKYRELAQTVARSRTYLVGATGTEVEPKTGHVWDLAQRGLLDAVSAAGRARLANDSDAEKETFQLFLRRWLLLYTQTRFEEFLSVRGTYPHEFEPIFDHYHMRDSAVSDELIDSAKAMANFISNQCHHAAVEADGDTDQITQQNIASMESLIEDATSTSELASRLIVNAGRLAGGSVSPEAEPFLDALHAEDRIELKKAANMLLSYLRLRQPSSSGGSGDDSGEDSDTASQPGGTAPNTGSESQTDSTDTESFHNEATQ